MPEQGKEFANRRTVIKGLAASVPVIMTLTSGKAAAQASTYQCIGKPGGVPQLHSIPLSEAGTDIWYRYVDPNDPDRLLLWYADTNGVVSTDPNSGEAFTASCYASFMPTL